MYHVDAISWAFSLYVGRKVMGEVFCSANSLEYDAICENLGRKRPLLELEMVCELGICK